jgi:hypothetical protein
MEIEKGEQMSAVSERERAREKSTWTYTARPGERDGARDFRYSLSMPRLVSAALTLAVLLCFATGAEAEESVGVTAAEALFEEGRAALAQGELDLACERFRASERLDPAIGTRLNLADCEERRGRLATAWSLFRNAALELPPTDDRLPIARQRAEELAFRVPRLKLELAPGAPSGTSAAIDDAEFGSGSFGVPLPMDPGHYVIAVRAPGRETRHVGVDLVPGKVSTVIIEPGPAPSAALPPATEESASAPGRNPLLYVLASLGVAGVATGTITGVMTLEKKSVAEDNCDDELKLCNEKGKDANDDGRLLGNVSAIGFVVGALGLGGAFYLWVSEPSDPTSARIKARVSPDFGFLSVERRF